MSAAFNKLLLRAEHAKHIFDKVAACGVLDEQTFGELEAEYFEARRELLDCLDAMTGGFSERLSEVLS